jgi:hypothetical protein
MTDHDSTLTPGTRSKIRLLIEVVTLAVVMTGAFYSMKLDAQDREAKLVDRISSLEVSSGREFADKDELKEMRDDIKQLRSEVSEIKNILIRQRR